MKIVTAVVNNPDFIEMQYHTFKKFFKGSYEFIVFNDAKDFPDYTNGGDITIKTNIENTCKKLGIQCINIPNEHHKTVLAASIRAAGSMNYILKYQLQNPDKYLLLDSDMFLIDSFDIEKYSSYESAVVLQSRQNGQKDTISYIWCGVCYLDFTKLKNTELLDWNLCDYCDTGGMTKNWLSNQMNGMYMPTVDEIRWSNKTFHTEHTYFMKHLTSWSWDESEMPPVIDKNELLKNFIKYDVRNKNGKYFCEVFEGAILHYRAGCNWNGEGMELHKQLTQILKTILC
jgi:hypothetical protein